MTEAELASIEDGARGFGPEHSVRRLIEALREAWAEKLELEQGFGSAGVVQMVE